MALLSPLPSERQRRGAKGAYGIRCFVAALSLFWGLQLTSSAASAEFRLKAVFLFNFAQFVKWPSQAFPDAEAPLVIGVLGDDPFGSDLDATVRGERVNNRPLIVQRYRRFDEIKICHILFVSRSETDRLGQILSNLESRNILTVSDVEDFVNRGGMIRFVTEANKIRLRINVDNARSAGLKISSKLLRPAEIVGPGKS